MAETGGKVAETVAESPADSFVRNARGGPRSLKLEWLKDWRTGYEDFSQSEAASLLGIPTATYQNWERKRAGLTPTVFGQLKERTGDPKDPRLWDFHRRLMETRGNKRAPAAPENTQETAEAVASNSFPKVGSEPPSVPESGGPNETGNRLRLPSSVLECFRLLNIKESDILERFPDPEDAIRFLLKQAIYQEESGRFQLALDLNSAAKDIFLLLPSAPFVLAECQSMVELFAGGEFGLTDGQVEHLRGKFGEPEDVARRLLDPEAQASRESQLSKWRGRLENPQWIVLAADRERQRDLAEQTLQKAPKRSQFAPAPPKDGATPWEGKLEAPAEDPVSWQECLRRCHQALDRFEREQGGMVELQALNADLNRLTDPFLLELGSSGGKALWARGRICEIDTRRKSGEYLTGQCRRELLTEREILGKAIGKHDEAWDLYQQRKAELEPIEARYQELVAQAEARALRRVGA